jgi:hypothetical protein
MDKVLADDDGHAIEMNDPIESWRPFWQIHQKYQRSVPCTPRGKFFDSELERSNTDDCGDEFQKCAVIIAASKNVSPLLSKIF